MNNSSNLRKTSTSRIAVNTPFKSLSPEDQISLLFKTLHNYVRKDFVEANIEFERGFSNDKSGMPRADVFTAKSVVKMNDGSESKDLGFDYSFIKLMNSICINLSNQAKKAAIEKGMSEIEAEKVSFVKSLRFRLKSDMSTSIADIVYLGN